MKEKMFEVMRVLGLDVLLRSLFEKLSLEVTKKLNAFKAAVLGFLTRVFHRNGKAAA